MKPISAPRTIPLNVGTVVTVADNSGAKKAFMIGMPAKGNRHFAYLGEMINVVVKEAIPYGQVKKGEILAAVIIRTHKEKRRPDGSYVRFDDNACVIVDKEKKEPKGTRIFGPIEREVRKAGFVKIASLAPEVL